MKQIFSLFLAVTFCLLLCDLQAQSCGVVDCKSTCGRFVDANQDGFCDNGHISQTEKTTPDHPKTTLPESGSDNKEIPSSSDTMLNNSTLDSVITSQDTIENIDCQVKTTETKKKESRYHLFPILIGVFIAYLITFILVKCHALKKITHRKIWNVILTLTFLISCLLGLLLAFFIHYNYFPTWYKDILLYHVDFGIAMTLVALFHVFWHLNYFKTIFCKVKKKK